MSKRERLEQSLRKAIDRWHREPFVWGAQDCLLSLSDIIRDARGYDPAEYFRGRYSTRLGALRVTKEFGGPAGALEAMAYEARWIEIDPLQAFVGDIGVLERTRGALCGVIRDRQLWVGRNETAFTAVPTECVARAWRVR